MKKSPYELAWENPPKTRAELLDHVKQVHLYEDDRVRERKRLHKPGFETLDNVRLNKGS